MFGSCRSLGRWRVRWIGERGYVATDFGVGWLCKALMPGHLELPLGDIARNLAVRAALLACFVCATAVARNGDHLGLGSGRVLQARRLDGRDMQQ